MKSIYFSSILLLLIIAIGCQNQFDKEEKIAPLSDSTSITGLSPDSVKLVKSAGIRFKVRDVEKSSKAISEVALSFGGMVSTVTSPQVSANIRSLMYQTTRSLLSPRLHPKQI